MRDGGASFRFIVPGSMAPGRTLLKRFARYVMERGFVVADHGPFAQKRRLAARKDKGSPPYRQMVQNFTAKTMPEKAGAQD